MRKRNYADSEAIEKLKREVAIGESTVKELQHSNNSLLSQLDQHSRSLTELKQAADKARTEAQVMTRGRTAAMRQLQCLPCMSACLMQLRQDAELP